MRKIIQQIKWFLTLKDGNKVIVLFCAIIGLILYNQHRISIDNKHLAVSIERERSACDSSILAIIAERNMIQKEAQAKVDTFINRLLLKTEIALDEQKRINRLYESHIFKSKNNKK